MDDEEPPEQLIIDDHQSGLHNQNNEEDGWQDGDNPVAIKQGTSELGDGSTWGAEGQVYKIIM